MIRASMTSHISSCGNAKFRCAAVAADIRRNPAVAEIDRYDFLERLSQFVLLGWTPCRVIRSAPS